MQSWCKSYSDAAIIRISLHSYYSNKKCNLSTKELCLAPIFQELRHKHKSHRTNPRALFCSNAKPLSGE